MKTKKFIFTVEIRTEDIDGNKIDTHKVAEKMEKQIVKHFDCASLSTKESEK